MSQDISNTDPSWRNTNQDATKMAQGPFQIGKDGPRVAKTVIFLMFSTCLEAVWEDCMPHPIVTPREKQLCEKWGRD